MVIIEIVYRHNILFCTALANFNQSQKIKTMKQHYLNIQSTIKMSFYEAIVIQRKKTRQLLKDSSERERHT